MSHMTQADLQDRYGRPSRARSRLLIGVLTVVAAIGLGWLGWVAWYYSTPQVSSELIGFEVESEHLTTAQVQINLRDDVDEGTCELRALAEDHSTVGDARFTVPVPDATGEVATVEIRTERRATSIDLIGCTTPEQSRPR